MDFFMAQATWEKPSDSAAADALRAKLARKSGARWKFLVGGALLLGAIAYLISSGMMLGARFFISVDEVVDNPDYVGQSVRLTGVVLGDTIVIDESDPRSTEIRFTIAAMPREFTNLAEALHQSAEDPNATRLNIVVRGQPQPELLQHEAQAILTGVLNDDGIFYATEMNFKCPSRFEEAGPSLQGSAQDHPGMRMQNNAG
jgi:cytochrome c-type biogenesis protein CcmE